MKKTFLPTAAFIFSFCMICATTYAGANRELRNGDHHERQDKNEDWNNDYNVPKKVLRAYEDFMPDAQEVQWSQSKGEYRAVSSNEFLTNVTVLSKHGEIIETHTVINGFDY